MDKFYITIGRQYGSGGKEIGQKLAARLEVPFYDKELLTAAAKQSGICEEMFEAHDEKPTNSFLYSLVMGGYGGGTPMNHKLFLAQFDAIKDLAKKSSCVILGRCADYALEGHPHLINVFIHADIDFRVRRGIATYNLDPNKAKDIILKTDKGRAGYYNFYSGKKWGQADTYDLCINSAKVGIDGAVDMILDFMNRARSNQN